MVTAAVELTDLIKEAGAIIAVAAGLGVLLLLPLYFSQRRDIKRLVELMELEPNHPVEDVQASEVLLDRAEVELEALTPPPEPEPAMSTVAQRVTSERPALERITMERAALIPHPRWRRFVSTVTQPRWLAVIAAAAVLLAAGAIFGSQALLELGNNEKSPRAGAPDTGEVTVAVLNGTDTPDLGSKVGDDVKANGFDLGLVSTFGETTDQTVVLYEKGFERAARKLSA